MAGLIVIFAVIFVTSGLIALGLLFYLRAVISRKTYRCRQCGEIVDVELMHASHCNTCGAPLNLPERHHA